MVIRLRGQNVPDAFGIVLLIVSVADDEGLRAVGFYALEIAVYGIQAGHDVYHAVVGQPCLVDINAAGGVLIVVFAHHCRKGL